MDYDPYNPIPKPQQNLTLFLSSSASDDHIAVEETSSRYLISYITHIIFKISKKSDPIVAYLTLNIGDCYISKNPDLSEPNVPLRPLIFVAVCCLRIAWKLRHKGSCIFKDDELLERISRTLEMQNTEVRILKNLDWDVRPVAPFYFVPIIANLISSLGLNRRTINEIIVQSIIFKLVAEHRAPVIAASALLTATFYLNYPHFEIEIGKLISLGFDKESLRGCTHRMILACKELKLFNHGNQSVGGESDQEKGEFEFELRWIEVLEKTTLVKVDRMIQVIKKVI